MELIEILGIMLAALWTLVVGLWRVISDKIKLVKDSVDEQKDELSKVRHRLVDLEINTDRGTAVKLLIEGQHELRDQMKTLSHLIESHIAMDSVLGRMPNKRESDK